MTKLEAFELMPDGYSQAELQFIWRGSSHPICEIMALVDVTKGEAMQIWNARKNGEAEFETYLQQYGR